MSIGSSPPQQPPQLSPDGRWIWDGHQWQPIPVVAGDLAGVVLVPAAAAAPAPAPAPSPAPAPAPASAVVSYSPPQNVAPPPEETAAPLWQEPPRQGISLYLFVAAALVVLVMAMMALSSLQIVRLPWQSDGQTPVKVAVTPPPQLPTRSEYARAERFQNFTLSPALAALNEPFTAVYQTCSTLSNSCHDAATASDEQVKKVVAVIDRADIPPCIAAEAGKMRTDFVQMDEALQLALKGYAANKYSEASPGIQRFGTLSSRVLSADAKALDQALKAQCNTDPTGP
jgi:hypothetical protein